MNHELIARLTVPSDLVTLRVEAAANTQRAANIQHAEVRAYVDAIADMILRTRRTLSRCERRFLRSSDDPLAFVAAAADRAGNHCDGDAIRLLIEVLRTPAERRVYRGGA